MNRGDGLRAKRQYWSHMRHRHQVAAEHGVAAGQGRGSCDSARQAAEDGQTLGPRGWRRPRQYTHLCARPQDRPAWPWLRPFQGKDICLDGLLIEECLHPVVTTYRCHRCPAPSPRALLIKDDTNDSLLLRRSGMISCLTALLHSRPILDVHGVGRRGVQECKEGEARRAGSANRAGGSKEAAARRCIRVRHR